MSSDDTELMSAYVHRGDDNALAALVERHSVWLTAFLKGMLRAEDVDDAFQQVWFRIIRRSVYYRGGNVKAYILRTARNVALNIIDHEKTTQSIDAVSDNEESAVCEMESDAPTPSESVQSSELITDVVKAIHSLPVQEREVILLRIEGELSLEEISKEINVPLQTVKTRMRRARQRLKQLLGERS